MLRIIALVVTAVSIFVNGLTCGADGADGATICVVTIGANGGVRLRVIDGDDLGPVPMATVFAKSGVIIGLTDGEGFINVASASDFPVTVRCMGYEAVQCDGSQAEIRLETSPLSLHEVVVTPGDRPIARIVCYVREYVSGATGTDTLISYNEHMADFFIPTRDKVKGFSAKTEPRFLRSRLRTRKTDSTGLDSIFTPDYRDDTFAWENLVEMPKGELSETEAILGGAKSDSVMGKHGIKQRIRKSDGNYIVATDHLADVKNHTLSPFIFKMLGLSIDFNELQGTWVYRDNDRGRYRAHDIVSGTFSLSVLGRGRWIKKAFKTDTPIQMYALYEIYPVEVQYLTVQEAKEQTKTPPRTPWQSAPNAAPPAPGALPLLRH